MAGIRPILKGWMLVLFMMIISIRLPIPVQAGFGGQPLGDIAWSPDGSMLVGVGTTSEPVIYAVQEDGTVTIQNEDILSLFAGGNYFPATYERAIAWSPDSTQFAVMSESLYSADDDYVPYTRLLLFDASAPQEPVSRVTLTRNQMTLIPSLFWMAEGLIVPAYVDDVGTSVYGFLPQDLRVHKRLDTFITSSDSTYYPMAIHGDYVASIIRQSDAESSTQQVTIINSVDITAPQWTIPLSASHDFTQIAWDANTDIAVVGRSGAIEVYNGHMDDPNFTAIRAYFLLPEVRSIVNLEWSVDGDYLAAVDDTGNVFIWTGEGQAVNLSAFELERTLVIDWHPQEPLLALGFWNGDARLIDLSE